MRVLITGAAGFIGSNLYKRCLEEGWDVEGVDDLSNGHLEFLPTPELWHADFTADFILDFIRKKKYDVVFHLAAVPRVGYSVEHPLETNDTNVTKTLKLIEACKGNIKRFVFASSSSVYDGENLPSREDQIKNPKSPYAAQKSIIEQYLKLYGELYGLESICLRFFNVFGPNQIAGSAYSMALSSWLDAIKRGDRMRSDGDGTQTRDMCYVDNVVDACVKAALHRGITHAECFNVACGDSISNNEIMQFLMGRYPTVNPRNAPQRLGDVMHTLADISKAKMVLGYVPLVTARNGIDRTCDWFDANWSWVKDLKSIT